MGKMKKKHKSQLISFVIIAIGLFWLVASWISFVNTPIVAKDGRSVEFLYTQGTSVYGLANHLHHRGALKNPIFFLVLAKLDGRIYSLQAGQYQIDPGMKPDELLQRMVRGEVLMHTFTIIDGWTLRQVMAVLQANPYVTHTLQNVKDDEMMRLIGHEGEIPEGRFAPDTYLFHVGLKDTGLLKLAYNLMQKRLDQAWQQRAINAPYKCPYEALIAASIIEKETAVENERFKVSGVIMRRLQKNMTLGMDSTVIYGLYQDFSAISKMTSADWKKGTVYNTYVRRGLPPTPIAMPSQNSIIAALHPEESDLLYFVAKGDGTHKFSATFKEHNEAVRKYLKKTHSTKG